MYGKPRGLGAVSMSAAMLSGSISSTAVEEVKPFGWVRSFVNWMWHSSPKTAGVSVVAAPSVAHHARGVSLLGTQSKITDESIEKIARETREDKNQDITTSDAWARMEDDDDHEVKRMKSRDVSERADVHGKMHHDTKEQLLSRGQTHISNVWSALEQQDNSIESSLQNEDLTEYRHLNGLQEQYMDRLSAQVRKAEADTLQRAPRPLLTHSDHTIGSKTLHDSWRALETQDDHNFQRIRQDPDLQMLQVDDRHHPNEIAMAQ